MLVRWVYDVREMGIPFMGIRLSYYDRWEPGAREISVE